MSKIKIITIIYWIILCVLIFVSYKASKRKESEYVNSLKEIRAERDSLYMVYDNLVISYEKLDSLYFEIKKVEIFKEAEYNNLKSSYNNLKYENKNKNTPIKQFNVAQLDSFWTKQN